MSKIEKRVLADAAKFGFTYHADSMFKSYNQGRRIIGRLVARGFLVPNPDPTEYDFHITKEGREAS